MVFSLVCKTKTGTLPVLSTFQGQNEDQMRLFIFIALFNITNAKQISFYSKPSYYYPMWKDSNITKLSFKNYKTPIIPQMIPIEQFLQMLFTATCLKIR